MLHHMVVLMLTSMSFYFFSLIFKIIFILRWFHKNVLRKEAERLLLIPSNPRGTFLVRNSENAPGKILYFLNLKAKKNYFRIKGPYSLSVRDIDEQRGPHVKHYKIRYPDPKVGYFIAARRTFKTLEELIDHYTSKISFIFFAMFFSIIL